MTQAILRVPNTSGYPTKTYVVFSDINGEPVVSITRLTLVKGEEEFRYATLLKTFKDYNLYVEEIGFRTSTLNYIDTLSQQFS